MGLSRAQPQHRATIDPAVLQRNQQAEIVVALRDGKRPDGSIIGPPMPIPVYRQLSDHDTEAIAAYLLSLKPVKNPLTRLQYTITLPPHATDQTQACDYDPASQLFPRFRVLADVVHRVLHGANVFSVQLNLRSTASHSRRSVSAGS